MDAATRKRVGDALAAFWGVRDAQHAAAITKSNAQGGTRSAVVGGQHLNAVRHLIEEELRLVGVPAENIHRAGKWKTMPGWFRPTKNWDLAVSTDDAIVALFEFKSQVGSFGNNANNRAEEAVGNATDIVAAANKGLIPIKPWLGFVYVIEDCAGSRSASRRPARPFYAKDPVFEAASYVDRFRLLAERSVADGLYQAAWVAATTRPDCGFAWCDAGVHVGYGQMQQRIRQLAHGFDW